MAQCPGGRDGRPRYLGNGQVFNKGIRFEARRMNELPVGAVGRQGQGTTQEVFSVKRKKQGNQSAARG